MPHSRVREAAPALYTEKLLVSTIYHQSYIISRDVPTTTLYVYAGLYNPKTKKLDIHIANFAAKLDVRNAEDE